MENNNTILLERPETEYSPEEENIEAAGVSAAGVKRGGAHLIPRQRKKIGVMGYIGRALSFVFATVVIVLFAALGVLYLMSRGPSDSARDLFVLSVRETSAAGFLAEFFLSEEEIALIESANKPDISPDSIDTSLITIQHNTESGNSEILPGDEDGDGIEIIDIAGPTYTGKMMIISNPNRVIVGVSNMLGTAGQTLEGMIGSYGAVGGVNGGGFYDPNGSGNGGIPDGIVIHEGKLLYGHDLLADTAVIDYDGILHVGTMTGRQALELNAQWAISFGPVLVVNGEKCSGLGSGLNPRTAIGQRSDGAILLLVINGRQLDSMGATYEDVADVMLEHGAVNALNLDGGSSTTMIYEGEFMNVSASLVGQRGLPTSVLVLPEGGNDNG